MALPTNVAQLVDYFRANVALLKQASYKEAVVRQELIDPLFIALGWDVGNRKLAAPEDREVVHEASLRIGGTLKAPDYLFRADGRRRFYVEAKKPSVNIAEARAAAYQIRRYCWNAGLPFGIVTDFEEFAVYDCRIQPDLSDSPAVGRIEYFTFEEYEDRWEWIESTFGRNGVASGSLDRLAAGQPPPRGTRSIDVAFLDEIRNWRARLASDLAARNKELDEGSLNSAVQNLIDRIVFLRIAEARGLEPDGELDRTRADGTNIYPRLLQLFQRADDRYNSGLFHFRKESSRETEPDQLAHVLRVGDSVLNYVLARLYYPEPYEFAVIPADILGQVYEQFLGEVITTSGRGVEVTQKPEVRKSGGIYYTPQPIVEYIVRQTLSKVLSGKTVSQVEDVKIIDPACGSGSFLIEAYQYLIDWHIAIYSEQPRNAKKFLERGNDGTRRLKIAERRRILVNNIFGVDVDAQAVEVAKLSLLLKLIEGQQQLELEVGRLLPDLDRNIRCGNSIVDTDFEEVIEAAGRTPAGSHNPFNWRKGFPSIMTAGGFDAVIGNPPYFSVDAVWGKGDERLAYLRSAFADVYTDKTDVLFYFLHRAVTVSRAEIAFIVSRSFLEAAKAQRLRQWLPSQVRVREILDFQHAQVFPRVGINTAIVRLTHSSRTGDAQVRRLTSRHLPAGYRADDLVDSDSFETLAVPQAKFGASSWIFGDEGADRLIRWIDSIGDPVGSILHIGQGMQTGRNTVFQGLAPEEAQQLVGKGEVYIRVRNSAIYRYRISATTPYLIYPEKAANINELSPAVRRQLHDHERELKERAAYQRGNCEWWKYTWPLHSAYVDRARIFSPYMARTNTFALDESAQFIGITDTTVLYENDQRESMRYILGILNSSVMCFRHKFLGKLKGGGVYEYFENTVSKLPIPRRGPGDTDHDEIVKLVSKRMELEEERARTQPGAERAEIDGEILHLEANIDEVVFSIFDMPSDDRVALMTYLSAHPSESPDA